MSILSVDKISPIGSGTTITLDAAKINVGTGVTLESNGQGIFSGIVTATSFNGSTLAVTGSASVSGDLDVASDIRHIGDTDTRLRFETDTISARTAGSERLRITSGGTVQFKGDANPVAEFDRGSANTTNLNLKYNGTFTGQISAANADFQISAVGASTPISFYTNGDERLRIDSGGRFFINRTAQHASSSERLSVNGMTSIQLNSTSAAGLYIFNEDTTTSGSPTQPFIYLHDGSGIRGGLGVQRSSGITVLNGQFGLSLRTGSSGVAGTERLRITSTGNLEKRTGGSYFAYDSQGHLAKQDNYDTNGGKSYWYDASAANGGTNQAYIDGQSGDIMAKGNFVVGTAGKGIDFSATSDAAGKTSELLDDYEEGSWTPDLVGTGGADSWSSAIVGAYTKIGNQVTVRFSLRNYVGNVSGSLTITGLPYNNNFRQYGGDFGIYNIDSPSNTIGKMLYLPTGSTLYLYWEMDNTGGTQIQGNQLKSGTYIEGNFTYQVA